MYVLSLVFVSNTKKSVVQNHEMTSEVESELDLPPERAKHDPMITVCVVVAASIDLQSPV